MTYTPSPHLSKLACFQALDEVTDAQERMDFGTAGRVLYDFFWDSFADWYVEAAKTRLYGQDPGAAATTRKVCPGDLQLADICRA